MECNNKYSHKTYGMASVWLEDGVYTRKQIEEILHAFDIMDGQLRKSMKESYRYDSDEGKASFGLCKPSE